MHGLNSYDYGARRYYSAIPMWDRMDPMAEKYYNVSPYIYCAGDPINNFDSDGRDWYQDNNGTYLWNPKVLSSSDFSERDAKRGFKYIGSSFSQDGACYRNDGSIMYDNPSAAYRRMWSQTFYWKGHKEESAYILENGKVLVMSDNWNDNSTSKHVGYSVSKNIIRRKYKNGEHYEIIGQVHTHPEKNADKGLSISYYGPDDRDFAKTISGIPVFILQRDGNLYGGVYDAKGNGIINFRNSSIGTVRNVLSGKTSLHSTAREIIDKFVK